MKGFVAFVVALCLVGSFCEGADSLSVNLRRAAVRLDQPTAAEMRLNAVRQTSSIRRSDSSQYSSLRMGSCSNCAVRSAGDCENCFGFAGFASESWLPFNDSVPERYPLRSYRLTPNGPNYVFGQPARNIVRFWGSRPVARFCRAWLEVAPIRTFLFGRW